jgi:hypothetical protein
LGAISHNQASQSNKIKVQLTRANTSQSRSRWQQQWNRTFFHFH